MRATEPYGTSLFSPLSIIAKAIVDAITTPPRQHYPSHDNTNNQPPTPPTTHVLHFFAGFHTAPSDPFFGASGLMASLLAQLLSTPGLLADAEIGDEAKRFHQRDIGPANIGALCELFAGLVRRKLPDGAVLFVVVDGLHLFARNEVERDARAARVSLKFGSLQDLLLLLY